MIGLEVLRAEARDVPTASSPSVREAGEARACAALAARPNSAERSEAALESLSAERSEAADILRLLCILWTGLDWTGP